MCLETEITVKMMQMVLLSLMQHVWMKQKVTGEPMQYRSVLPKEKGMRKQSIELLVLESE